LRCTRLIPVLAFVLLAACAARTAPPVVTAEVAEQLFSTAKDDLARFEQPSNEARFDALTALLKSRGIPFEVEPFTIEPHEGESRTAGRNVVVTLPGREPEIVVGAHYDASRLRDGTLSRGAVDNAASVVVLVRLAETLSRARARSRIRIVFFDMEELGLLGSARYVQDHRDRKTLAMVNLDVNAFGGALMFGPHTGSNDAVFQAMREVCVEVSRACIEMPRMPPSDDLSFQKTGVPTLSIATLPELQGHQLLLGLNGGQESGLESKFVPGVFRTIHTASDTSALVEPGAMALAYRAVMGLIRRLE
jgi:hypothetical protein